MVLLSILERRKVLQPLMGSLLVVKVDPRFCSSQELSQGMIGATIRHSHLEEANKAFCIPTVGGRSRSTHGEDNAFAQEHLAGFLCTIWLALIAVPDRISHVKGNRLDGVQHQFGTHVVIKSDAQHLARAMAQRKAATHPCAIGQLDLQNIGEHHFLAQQVHPLLAQLIGRDLRRFAGIHIFLAFAPGSQTILAHDPLDAILPRSQQRSQFAVAHGIIFLVCLLNPHGQRFVQLWTLALHVETTSGNAQDRSQLTFVDQTVGSTQRPGQFHLLLFALLPNSPRDFFRISFCTVSSPISFFRSSGDSPGSYPCAFLRLFGSRWSANISGPRCWNACLQRLTTEAARLNLRQTSSRVVSRWKLSMTTLNLNSGSYC